MTARRALPVAAVAAVVATAALAVLATGCTRTQVAEPAVARFPRSEDELQFLDALDKQVVVTNDDAMHAFIIFTDGKDLSTDYAGRVQVAKAKEWVGRDWSKPANESAEIGWMAVAGCRAIGVKGGMTMRVLGPTPRYCTKELVFMGILPLRTENQSLTGQEFVDFLNRLGRAQKFGKPTALQGEGAQAGVGVIPAGAPNQLVDQSAVEFGLPTGAVRLSSPPPPEPATAP
jgi:hypothetical protein